MMYKSLCVIFLVCCISAFGQERSHNILRGLRVNDVYIGSTKEKVVSAFGVPDSIITEYDEMEGKYNTGFQYGKSIFYFNGEELEDFDLFDANFKLFPTGLSVGESECELKKHFPESYALLEAQHDGQKIIRVYYGDMIVTFVVKNGIIYNIFTSSNQ